MQETGKDYKKLLTEAIKKQIIILGPDITLAKARGIKKISVADDGTVTEISGDGEEIIAELVAKFRELSPISTKKTMGYLN